MKLAVSVAMIKEYMAVPEPRFSSILQKNADKNSDIYSKSFCRTHFNGGGGGGGRRNTGYNFKTK